MTSRELPRLSLEDLASVIDGALNELSEDAWIAVKAVIAAMYSDDSGHAEQLAELRAMARGTGCKFLGDALVAHQRLEKLLASDDWEHPVEVLGGDPGDISYRSLIRLAATLAGEADDPSRILAVKSKLEILAKEGEERADGT